MKPRLLCGALLLSLAAMSAVALSQDHSPGAVLQDDVKLPNGKSQRDEILKVERDDNIKDAAHLVELAQSLRDDLEKSDRFVLSMDTLKKTDDIEKLARKIRTRLRH